MPRLKTWLAVMMRLVFNLGIFFLGYFFGFYLGEDYQKKNPEPIPVDRLKRHEGLDTFVAVDLERLRHILRYTT